MRISCPFAIIVLKNNEKHTKKQEKRERKTKTKNGKKPKQHTKKQKQKTTYAGIAKLICMHMANEPTPEVMQCRVTRL